MSSKEWLNILNRVSRNRLNGSSRVRRCILLIDGDNVPPRLTGAIIHYASGLGRVEVLEVFANFASTNSTGWAAQMREYGITGFQHHKTTTGKNSADVALIVRGMDLLHTKRYDHYVLASTDADFSALAHRLRKSGASVHGIGSSNASPALRQSCTRFITFQELGELVISTSAEVPADLWKRPPKDAEDRLLHAIVRLGGARAWVSISALGQELKSTTPTFDPRSYSSRSLTDLCEALGSIYVDRTRSDPHVRLALGNRNGSPGEQNWKS